MPRSKMSMNDESERAWKESIMTYFKIISQHFGGIEESHENLSGVLSTWLPRSASNGMGIIMSA
jgi:hypothetical protein